MEFIECIIKYKGKQIEVEKAFIRNAKDLEFYISEAIVNREIITDFEANGLTDDLFLGTHEVIGASFAYFLNKERTKMRAFWVPINHKKIRHILYTGDSKDPFRIIKEKLPNQVSEQDWFLESNRFYSNPDVTVIAHNAKYERRVHVFNYEKLFGKYPVLKARLVDTLMSSYLLGHDVKGLKERLRVDIGINPKTFNDVVPKGQEKDGDLASIDKMSNYGIDDSINTGLLKLDHYTKLNVNIGEHRGKIKLWEELEGPNIEYLTAMEHNGVLVDIDKLINLDIEFREQISELDTSFRNLANVDTDFNINSPKQLLELLFPEYLKELPPEKDWKGNPKERLPSTGKDYLSEIIATESYNHPNGDQLLRTLFEYRQLTKLHGTYVVSLIKMALDNIDSRVHGSFNQAVASTNRLTSSGPNLQNIPIRSANGRKIRECFVAKPGYKWVSADYSQLEVRLLAHLSNCKGLINVYENNLDIYRDLASQFYKVDYDLVDSEQRFNMKSVVLGRNYGLGVRKFAQDKLIPIKIAEGLYRGYDEAYPEIGIYRDSCNRFACKNGYIKTLLGHSRNFKLELSRNQYIGNVASNLPVQGLAGGVVKLAQRNIMNRLVDIEWWQTIVFPLVQVHDQLDFEVREDKAEEFEAILKEEMEMVSRILNLRVDLLVDSAIADNWLGAH